MHTHASYMKYVYSYLVWLSPFGLSIVSLFVLGKKRVYLLSFHNRVPKSDVKTTLPGHNEISQFKNPIDILKIT